MKRENSRRIPPANHQPSLTREEQLLLELVDVTEDRKTSSVDVIRNINCEIVKEVGLKCVEGIMRKQKVVFPGIREHGSEIRYAIPTVVSKEM
ncbi:hypothetical protein TNCV_1590621 [Trichonephila clavipes]|nr:hypothetical protein TNCV_1590621 [Trichonephila clavipes]